MNKQINLLKPSPTSAEINAVTKVLKSGWWGMGPVTKQFEEEFATYAGAKYCVAVNSATAALHLAVRILNDEKQFKGGNIIVPALTFVSTALAGLYEGLDVVFADIDEETLCLDPKDVNRKKTPSTIAVIPVHYAGITAPSLSSHVNTINDAAHAAGNKEITKNGVMSCWSFHAVKNLATGDMGAITTDDKVIYDKLMRLRWCGISLDTWSREKKGYNWEYDITEIGYKYHTNDIMASIALAQLHRLDRMNARRAKIATAYRKSLGHVVKLPPESATNHLFVIRVAANDRDKLVEYMRERNVSPGVHYKPIHTYSIFKPQSLPVTERVWKTLLSIPIHPDMTDHDVGRVIQVIKDYYDN
jgi:perosamine synthetase